MNKPKTDRRVRKTKEALRQGLITLLKDKNLQSISVQELTEEADIHRGTFYLHYSDIYDLYEQIENQVIEEIDEILNHYSINKSNIDPVPALEDILTFVAENAEICEMLLTQGRNGTFVKKLSQVINHRFMHISLQHMDLEATELELRYLGDFLVFGYIAVISNWLAHGMPEPPHVMAERIGKYGAYGISYYELNPGSSLGVE